VPAPQHARVPSALIPHMKPELPVLTATKLPVGSSPMLAPQQTTLPSVSSMAQAWL
jgi:hypothetical protein